MPSSEKETRLRGCYALERGGDSAARRLALERDGDSPEGCRSQSFGSRCSFLGRGPFVPGHDHTECVLGLWTCSFVFYNLFEKGVFPGY
jgi:hypothetical protein